MEPTPTTPPRPLSSIHSDRFRRFLYPGFLILSACFLLLVGALAHEVGAQGPSTLSAPFQRLVLDPALPESPFHLRFFSTAVKTDSQGRILTGPTSDPVKNLVGAEPAGVRAGLQRFTKILFGAGYIDGRPDPGTRIDPNDPVVKSGSQH